MYKLNKKIFLFLTFFLFLNVVFSVNWLNVQPRAFFPLITNSNVSDYNEVTGIFQDESNGYMNFDGTGSYVNMTINFNATASNWTVSTWINPDVIGFNNVIFSCDETALNFQIDGNLGGGAYRVYDGSSWHFEEDTGFTVDSWQLLTVTYSGTNLSLYRNAVLINSTTTTISGGSGICRLGNRADLPTRAFDGDIDEFTIYSKSLNISEIYELNLSGRQDNKPTSDIIYYNSLNGLTDFSQNNVNATATTQIQINSTQTTFDGVNDFIRFIEHPGDKIFDGNNWAISSWVNIENATSTLTVYSENRGGNANRVSLFIDNGKILGSWYGTADRSLGAGNTTLNTSQWYYITWVRNGANEYYYIDGVLDKSGVTNSENVIISSSPDPAIGRRAYAVSGWFEGGMKDFLIYNASLSQSQVTQLYNNNGSPILVDITPPTINVTIFNNLTEPIELNYYEMTLFEIVNISVSDFSGINFTKYFFNNEEIPPILLLPIEDRPDEEIEAYTGISFSFEESSPDDADCYEDICYFVGSTNDLVYLYNRSPFGYSGTSYSVGAQEGQPTGIDCDENFCRLVGSSSESVHLYNRSPFVYTGISYSVSAQGSAHFGLYCHDDGNFCYTTEDTSNRIYKYNKSNFVYTGISSVVGGQDNAPRGITCKDNLCYVTGDISNTIYQYNETNLVYTGNSFYVGSQDASPRGLTILNHSLFMIGDSLNTIYKYSMVFNDSIFRFDSFGNKIIQIISEDTVGNVAIRNLSFNLDPFQFFRFKNESGDPVTNFSFGGVLYEEEVKQKLSFFDFGNTTFLFSKTGFIDKNLTFEFTNTSNYNLNISIPFPKINVFLYDRETNNLITSLATITIATTENGRIFTTDTGLLTADTYFLGSGGTITVSSSIDTYSPESTTFLFSNKGIKNISLYPLLDASSIPIIFRCLDKDTGLSYKGALITANELNDEGVWESITSGFTDQSTGFLTLSLEEDKWYVFSCTYQGREKSLDMKQIIEAELIEIELPSVRPTINLNFLEMGEIISEIINITVANQTVIRGFYTDSKQVADSFCFKVFEYVDYKKQKISETCLDSTSGIFLFPNVNIGENYTFKANTLYKADIIANLGTNSYLVETFNFNVDVGLNIEALLSSGMFQIFIMLTFGIFLGFGLTTGKLPLLVGSSIGFISILFTSFDVIPDYLGYGFIIAGYVVVLVTMRLK